MRVSKPIPSAYKMILWVFIIMLKLITSWDHGITINMHFGEVTIRIQGVEAPILLKELGISSWMWWVYE